MAKKIRKTLKKISKSSEVPASQGQLEDLRSEMKSEFASQTLNMRALEKRMEARFNKVDARFSENDAKFKSIDARFNQMEARFDQIDARFSKADARMNTFDARFDSLESKIESLTAAVHRTNAIVEEQNARNKFVIDGYKAVIDIQSNQESRVKRLEKATFGTES